MTRPELIKCSIRRHIPGFVAIVYRSDQQSFCVRRPEDPGSDGSAFVSAFDYGHRRDGLWLADSTDYERTGRVVSASGDCWRLAFGRCADHLVCSGALWLLLIALKRNNVWFAVASGAALGVACWLRVNRSIYVCFGAACAVFGSSTFAKTSLNERGHSAYDLYHHFANSRAQLSRLS
jgi:hypothetical protein